MHCLIADQAAARRQWSIERRIRDARFRDNGTLESFDWRFNKTIGRGRTETSCPNADQFQMVLETLEAMEES